MRRIYLSALVELLALVLLFGQALSEGPAQLKKVNEGITLYGNCNRTHKTPETKPYAYSLQELGLGGLTNVDTLSVGFWFMKTSTTPDHGTSASNDF